MPPMNEPATYQVPATPLVLLDLSPIPGPALTRRVPELLRLLADGGTATERFAGQRRFLRLYDAEGRLVWVTPSWVDAWEQVRERQFAYRLGWTGPVAYYEISEAGREALAGLQVRETTG
jgi:hypothetical protein